MLCLPNLSEGRRLRNCQVGRRGRRRPDQGHCVPQRQRRCGQADPRAEGAQREQVWATGHIIHHIIWSLILASHLHRMTANEMAAQLLRETIQQQAVDAVSSTMPGLESAIKSGAGNNKLSARLPEFQYQLEVRQTGCTFGRIFGIFWWKTLSEKFFTAGKVNEMDLVTISYNAYAVKITDGSAVCNINDLTGDVLRITVTRRRKSEGSLIFFAEVSNPSPCKL